MTLAFFLFFFFSDTATTEIYTLSLHDALPILRRRARRAIHQRPSPREHPEGQDVLRRDRKSTRLNSSHLGISYAVFCLKKKKKKHRTIPTTIIHAHNARYRTQSTKRTTHAVRC